MKKLLITFPILLLIALSWVNITYAQSENSARPPAQGVENKNDLIDKVKEENSKTQKLPEDKSNFKCTATSSKMDLLVENYRKNFNRHRERYENIVVRVDELLTSLEEDGYDVTNARMENERFREQVEAVNNDFNAFENEMRAAQGKLCEDDITGFRESLGESRTQLRVIRNNMLTLRNSFEQNVKPELLKLKQSVAEDTDAEDEEIEDESNTETENDSE